MADISRITLPNGNTYDLKDAVAREALKSAIHYKGYTTTELTDGASTNPITIDGKSYTAVAGDVVIYKKGSGASAKDLEFIFNGTIWNEFGSTGTLKALAFADTASGSQTLDDYATGINATSSTVTSTGTFTPAGSVDVQLSQTPTAASLTREAYTPAGSINVTLKDASATTAAVLTTADYTPEGTVSKPDITVTPSTASVAKVTTVGSVTEGTAPVFEAGTDSFTPAAIQAGFFSAGTLPSYTDGDLTGGTLPSKTADSFTAPTLSTTVDNETLTIGFTAGSFTEGTFNAGAFPTYTKGTFSAGALPSIDDTKFSGGSFIQGTDTFTAGTTPSVVVLPTFGSETVMTGATAALDNAPVFTGTLADDLQVTGVAYTKQEVDAKTFTGTEVANFRVTGVSYDKAGVQSAGFTGTEGNVSVDGTALTAATLTTGNKTISITVNPDNA